jgi:hypothetical protein
MELFLPGKGEWGPELHNLLHARGRYEAPLVVVPALAHSLDHSLHGFIHHVTIRGFNFKTDVVHKGKVAPDLSCPPRREDTSPRDTVFHLKK